MAGVHFKADCKAIFKCHMDKQIIVAFLVSYVL